MTEPHDHPNCRCQIFEAEPYLMCDFCEERRPLNGLTIIGEIHGCAGLGAFRLIPATTVLYVGAIT